MKIVYLTSRYPNLSETFIAREMQQLANRGNEIIICRLKWILPWTNRAGLKVSPAYIVSSHCNPWSWLLGLIWGVKNKPNELRETSLDLKQAPMASLLQLKLLVIWLTTIALARSLSPLQINHIHSHFLHSEAVGSMWLSRLLGCSYSITAQTTVYHFPKSLIRKASNHATFCIGTISDTKSLLRELCHEPEAVHLIHTGLNLKEFSEPRATNNLSQPPCLISAARLVEKKGLDLLIRACLILDQQGVDYQCQIIGSGPEQNNLVQLIQDFSLTEKVKLLGAMSFEELKHCYQQADAMILPCREAKKELDRDGLPTVLVEALASGVPVVASNFAGVPDLILHEKTGLLVPPEDVDALANAIKRILSDNQLRLSLIKAGRKKVEAEFDIAKSAELLDNLICRTTAKQVNSTKAELVSHQHSDD